MKLGVAHHFSSPVLFIISPRSEVASVSQVLSRLQVLAHSSIAKSIFNSALIDQKSRLVMYKVFHKINLTPIRKNFGVNLVVNIFVSNLELIQLQTKQLNTKQHTKVSFKFKLINLAVIYPSKFFSLV